MATIHHEIEIACNINTAWVQLRNFGNAARLFAGILVDCEESSGVRTVTFANGNVVQEQLISVDDDLHRLAYKVLNGNFTHHNSSMQLISTDNGVKFVWTSDFLPDQASLRVEPLVKAGCQAIKQSLESL